MDGGIVGGSGLSGFGGGSEIAAIRRNGRDRRFCDWYEGRVWHKGGMDLPRGLPRATERLSFGIWKVDDIPLAETIWGDAEVTELTGGPFKPEAVAERLAQEMENWRHYHVQYWPLFRSYDGALVGCCGLRPRNMDERVAELGFQLCRESWGQGFASEAFSSVIEWSRANEFSALVAGHHPSNQASKLVLMRLGFSYTHDELYPAPGQMEPCYWLSL